ncbi:MAG TPA: Zn-dependent hydrolase [Dongiaceae bacterium]|nr:Zn-dependent hydrolase [Dongiaceae bacterium]
MLPEINAKRLLEDLRQLRRFGAEGKGVVRPALSPVDMAARHWLAERLRDAGLSATIDRVGTVLGRSAKSAPALLIGSHTDTQPTGGWLDGALGVIYGLEIARAFGEGAATRDLAIDVAAWSDEEGTFAGYLGSRSFVGEAVDSVIATARSRRGQSLADALLAAGLADRPRHRLEPGRHIAYLEPHIEQGGRLEATGKSLGVVTTIVGIREMRVVFTGQRNHAGTTPMAIRRDAGAALIDLAYRLNAAFRDLADADTVWTIGRIELDPGALSVIPGRAELLLQFRDADPQRLQLMLRTLADLVREADRAGPARVALEEADAPSEPVQMAAALQDHIAAAAEAIAPGQWLRMPSGAGHDAQVIAPHLPSGMLFIPSIGGISHDFAEDTDVDHIVLGCRVAAAAALRILRPAATNVAEKPA